MAADESLAYAARWRGDKYMPDSAAAHLVALADEVERLQAIEAAVRAYLLAQDRHVLAEIRSAHAALVDALNGGA